MPTASIQYGTKGNFVYAINKDNTVSVRPVVIGPALGDNTTITSGLLPGQMVVTEGADNLKDGATVLVSDPKSTSLNHIAYHLTYHLTRRFFT